MDIPSTLFTAFNRAKPCRYGTMVYNVHDRFIGRSLDLYGEFSEGEAVLFRQLIDPGMIVVEVGANIGAHTVFLAQAVQPDGFVFAFEPQRLIFQTLCANLALNSIANVHASQVAVGDTCGDILVPVLDANKDNNFGGLELGQHEFGERVPLVTLDSLNLSRCDFIKVDVEGMEKSVLDGAAATIARFQPLLYVENDRGEKSADLVRSIDAKGYKMFWHVTNLFNPDNYAGNAQNVFGNTGSFNMLCLPKGRTYKLEGFPPVDLNVATA